MNWKLLQKFLSGECSPDEKQQVKAWLRFDKQNQVFFDSLLKIWSVEPEDEIKVDAKSAWEAFQHKLSEEEDTNQKHSQKLTSRLRKLHAKSRRDKGNGRSIAYSLSAAALMLIVFLLYYFAAPLSSTQDSIAGNKSRTQQIITERGQRTTFKLFDGTRVQLNADSKIEISEAFGDSVRSVSLEGEAYFEVFSNTEKPFIVNSGNSYTRVLGTKFGVKAYSIDQQVQVVVEEGRVAFGSTSDSDSQGKHITKNQVGILSKDGKTEVKDIPEISTYLGWKEGRLIFESTPLSEVVSQLERWYDIEMVLADSSLKSKTITASFKDEPMTEVINIISLSLDARYKRDGRKITFFMN